MKKTILIIGFLLLFAANILAIPRTSSEALSIANSFYQKAQVSTKMISTELSTLKLAYTCTDGISTRSTSDKAFYYVFNRGENNGFIIVSGDDRAKDILGYSDTGNFDINSLPPNFATWLNCYKEELKYLIDQSESTSTSSVQLSESISTDVRQSTYSTSVSPLLGGIKWDQGSPYNNLCPIINDSTSERAATGCVATAMAQVMKYYSWPVSGTGVNTYTPTGFTTSLSVDFSKTTYDWANMTDKYNSSSAAIQKDAVATLMYHAGVSVNMMYGEYSSASSLNMAKALIGYFSYDSNIQSYYRDYYSKPEWEGLIKTELNAGRPVFYAGYSKDTGHQFVCDGYDSNGLFHFNWGWSGNSDGYFELSVLNPSSLGIGGGTSGVFNYDQLIVIGVQKPNASSTAHPYQLYLYSPFNTIPASVNRTSTFTLPMRITNFGINTFNGKVGLALYNDNGFVKLLSSRSSSLDTYSGYYNPSYATNITIPSEVVDGNYMLYSVFQSTGDSDWQIMRGKIGTPNYINVNVTSTNILFSAPDVRPKLTLNSITVNGNLYQNKTGKFNVSITNNGGEYNSSLLIYLKSAENNVTEQYVSNDPINIASGNTKSFDITGNIKLVPGQYYLYVMYDYYNNRASQSYVTLGDSIAVTVLPEPGNPILTLTSKVSFPDSNKVNKSNAVLTARIKNTGGYFNNHVIAYVYPSTAGNSLTYYGYQTLVLDTDEEKEITFSGNIDLDPGSYLTAVTYWDTTINDWNLITPRDNSVLAFTLVDSSTDIERNTSSKLLIYPNPVVDNLFLQSEKIIKIIRIMNISGKQVLFLRPEKSGLISVSVIELSPGTYVLQCESETGIEVCKFIIR